MSLDPRLRSSKEQPLFILSLVFAALFWLILIVTIIGVFYGAFIGLFLLVAHILYLAHVRGNGLRLSERQLPELYSRVRAASAALGLPRTPEVYVLQGGGVLNAFATKFLSRRFVVLLSDLVESCQDQRQLDFVVGHELAHHAAGHLAWRVFLAPAYLVPLLGPAYSRACEYTCDRAGASVCGDTEQAMRGLVVLAAGGRLAQAAQLEEFMAQADEAGHFWMAVNELGASHPYLCKRVAAVKEYVVPGSTRVASRNPLAYPLAPFLAVGGGGASGALVVVAVVGILAAIAIPNFVRYQQRSREAAAAALFQQKEEEDAARQAGEQEEEGEDVGAAQPDAGGGE
jgi:Zn-dependent protease with chaperone function